MNLDTCDVVWHKAPFKLPQPDGSQPERPWLIISNTKHPFHGTEYLVLGMTTNPRGEGIEVDASDWVSGGTSKTSYISPWFAMTLKDTDISHHIGSISDTLVTEAIDDLTYRLGPV